MIGYTPAGQAIRADRGEPDDTGADEPRHDQPDAQPEATPSAMTTVNVTAEHIAKGKRGECAHCPVALAIRDAFPDIAGVAVGPREIAIQHAPDGPWTELDPPDDVVLFILLFDAGDHEPPFSFELDYPAEVAA